MRSESVEPATSPADSGPVVAIVLSCDAYHPLAEHMMSRYRYVWPDHPFVFRVPYQSDDRWDDLSGRRDVQPVRTPTHIKATVLALIEDLPDDMWIYWCIDDKYVIELDVSAMEHAIAWLSDAPDHVQGLSLCRCRKLLSDEYLRFGDELTTPWGERLLARSTYHQFWLHSFLRVGFLRSLFAGFPDRHFVAKEMDAFTGQVDDVPDVMIPDDVGLMVTEFNHAVFGESTTAGKLTANVVESLVEIGQAIPGAFERSERRMTMGVL